MASSSQSRLVVRAARQEEHPELARLAVAHVAQPHGIPLSEAQYGAYFRTPGVRVFVAEVGGRHAGMVVAAERRRRFSLRVHVSALLTEPKFRSSSVASRLIRHVMDHCLERNAAALVFEAEHRLATKYLAHLKAQFPQHRMELVQTHSLGGGLGSYEIRLPRKPIWQSILNLLKRPGSK